MPVPLPMPPSLLPARAPRAVLDPIVRALRAAGVSPMAVSWAGLAGNLAAAWLIADGQLFAGGVVMLLASGLDMLDGALARAIGTASPAGALLDSTLDRISEGVVLFGVLWFELEHGHHAGALLAFVALGGSMLVSYVRARAEALHVAMTSGVFRRQERVVLLGVALLTGWLQPALWALAVFTVLTGLQRLWLGLRALEARR